MPIKIVIKGRIEILCNTNRVKYPDIHFRINHAGAGPIEIIYMVGVGLKGYLDGVNYPDERKYKQMYHVSLSK